MPTQPDPRAFASGVQAVADVLARGGGTRSALHTLAEQTLRLLDAEAVAVVLADRRGTVVERAACGSTLGSSQLAQMCWDVGPGRDSFRSGRSLEAPLLHPLSRVRWPSLCRQAARLGIDAVSALPLFAGDRVVGAVSLVHDGTPGLGQHEKAWARALASAVVTSVELKQGIEAAEARAAQLQEALDTRVVIEQAKGYLAGRRGVTVNDAFDLLRAHARSHNLRLRDLARQVIEGAADCAVLGEL